MIMEEIKIGSYRHFKGNIYEVIGIATHSETLENLVIYRNEKGDIWARPIDMWNETIERDGKTLKRFSFIDE